MSQQIPSVLSSSPGSVSDTYPSVSASMLDAPPEPTQHALVIGCGIAGMAAAKVLSRYFSRVTILERDQLPDQPKFRAGKPQARHAHVLLAKGLMDLEAIFPGLGVDLRQHGATKCQWGPDTRWYYFGGWRQRFPAAVSTVTCSVNLIEWELRRRIQQVAAIRILADTTAEELLAEGPRVVGVRAAQHRTGRGQKQLELRGVMVVDATGRRSMAPEWLNKLGIGPIPEEKVEAFWGYASRYYERPSRASKSWRMMAIHPTPPDSLRMGVILPTENNLWLVTLAGTNRDYPPDDDLGFLEFARGLAQPDLYVAIRDAKPVSGIYGYRYAENRWRHFERQERFLEGFVALGDAACQFNPIYGQGMSVAAMGAACLNRCLRANLSRHPNRSLLGLSRKFQSSLARDLTVPWMITTGEDLRFAKPEVLAQRSLFTRASQAMVKSILELATTDFQAFRSFVMVMHLVASPLRLLNPWLVLKVILHALFTPRRTPPPRPVRVPAAALPPALNSRAKSGEAWHPVTDPSGMSSFVSGPLPRMSPSAQSGPSGLHPPSAGTPSQLPVRPSARTPLQLPVRPSAAIPLQLPVSRRTPK